MTIKELKEKRAKELAAMRATYEESEGRDMTPEERSKFDKSQAEVERLEEQIRRAEQLARHEAFDREEIERQAGEEDRAPEEVIEDRARQMDAFEQYARFGMNSLNDEQRAEMVSRQANLSPEMRAQATGTDSAGGYTIPEGFMSDLERAMLAYGGMREAARVVRTTTGNDLPWPTSNDTGNKGALLNENTQVSEQDVTFGQKMLGAFTYTSKMIRVPVQLLQDSAFSLNDLLGDVLAERIFRATNEHFTVGTGSGQPNGVVTAAAAGVTFAAVGAVTADEFIDLQHTIDPAYRNMPGVRWMFHDNTLREVRQLKDGDGQYLLRPGLTEAEPDRILGKPYTINQDMPQIGGAQKSVLFGDFNKYIIRDVRDVTMLRLVERYADYLQVAFLGFSRHDGELLDAGTNPIKYGVHPSA